MDDPAPHDLVVMCSGAFVPVLNALLPAFHRNTGRAVTVIAGSSIGTTPRAIPVRLRGPEPADLVIVFDETLDQLMAEGLVTPGSKIPLATSGIGIAVPRGAPRPDIGSPEALRRAMLAIASFAYSASASGTYVASILLNKLGLPEHVGRRGFRVIGEPVGKVVARNEADWGFQQISELLPIEGIDMLGPLPPAVQQISTLSAGIPSRSRDAATAHALIAHLRAKASRPALRDAGLGAADRQP